MVKHLNHPERGDAVRLCNNFPPNCRSQKERRQKATVEMRVHQPSQILHAGGTPFYNIRLVSIGNAELQSPFTRISLLSTRDTRALRRQVFGMDVGNRQLGI